MRKYWLYPLLAILALLALFILGLVLSGNSHLLRAVQLTYLKGHNTANINDGKDFDTSIIATGEVQPWPLHENYNQDTLAPDLETQLRSSNSAAYLVVHKGKLHSEFYFEPYSNRSKTNSFSMAKTIMTMMIGAAIDEGLIKDFEALAKDYIPELSGVADEVRISHLTAMSSGVDWEEDYYTPFSPTPKLLYGYDVESYALSRDYPVAAGAEFYYASVSTQVLGIVLDRALKQANRSESLSQFLSRKFWQPMGMNDDGTWHTDAQGMELVYCCINTNARNFAKFGLLLSQKGVWNGQQLLQAAFVKRIIEPDLNHYYGHSVWIDERENPQFYLLMGHLGQYVIVVPGHDLVVVRLGEFRLKASDKTTRNIPSDVYFYVDHAIKRVLKPSSSR